MEEMHTTPLVKGSEKLTLAKKLEQGEQQSDTAKQKTVVPQNIALKGSTKHDMSSSNSCRRARNAVVQPYPLDACGERNNTLRTCTRPVGPIAVSTRHRFGR